MDTLKTMMARDFAYEVANALTAQLTMQQQGVTADFRAGGVAIGNANDALENLARAMGRKLVALDTVREGSANNHLEAAE